LIDCDWKSALERDLGHRRLLDEALEPSIMSRDLMCANLPAHCKLASLRRTKGVGERPEIESQ